MIVQQAQEEEPLQAQEGAIAAACDGPGGLPLLLGSLGGATVAA
jgi:hypothetical protein